MQGKMQLSLPKSMFKPTVFSKSHMVQRDENMSCCCSSGPAHQGFLHSWVHSEQEGASETSPRHPIYCAAVPISELSEHKIWTNFR